MEEHRLIVLIVEPDANQPLVDELMDCIRIDPQLSQLIDFVKAVTTDQALVRKYPNLFSPMTTHMFAERERTGLLLCQRKVEGQIHGILSTEVGSALLHNHAIIQISLAELEQVQASQFRADLLIIGVTLDPDVRRDKLTAGMNTMCYLSNQDVIRFVRGLPDDHRFVAKDDEMDPLNLFLLIQNLGLFTGAGPDYVQTEAVRKLPIKYRT
ncbi:MAG: hypothetical protein ABIH67_01000 [Candidatus Uhrbacteria bacterium]